MFNKLISNLPFNPSLINQVSFYAKRLKQETSVRRLGFSFVALTVFLQLFAVFSPAQPTLARPGNDIVPNGFTTKQQAVDYCNSNFNNFRDILLHFGITCVGLSAARIVSLTSTDKDYYSLGRLPQGPVNLTTGKATNEKQVDIKIDGVSTPFYMRKLSSWDTQASSTYKQVLAVGNIFDVPFWILFSCGNIVKIGPPATPQPIPIPVPVPTPRPTPPPTPTKPCAASKNINDTASCLVKSKHVQNVTEHIPRANNTVARAGDELIYTLTVKNTGRIRHRGFVMREDLTDVLEYAKWTNLDGGSINQNNVVSWSAQNINAHGSISHTITVVVKSPVPSTPNPCPATVTPCPDSGSFDLIMTNTFGNTVNIRLRPSLIKKTETLTTKTLPNTGPGTAVVISFLMASIVGYFFARSRLLAKEVDLIRQDYISGGI